ncbi:hypothetical protein KP509_07G065500 [Ceratopteris richardii]|uniref:Homogentisate geranylgeranyl transferase n=1 Tax=Ceratopteris richardii TaxID=49495 RepID=A0A8T2UHL5_CERRI|nr:hypothetical protein KP509_07G065500 [Ceratopteris richardii]
MFFHVMQILGVISVSFAAIQSHHDISLRFFVGLVQALVPAVLINIYVVGINQVIDVEIDKVNKPYLPLASGEFSLNTGISLSILCATLSFCLGGLVGSKPLMCALFLAYLIGTCYSLELPLLRWKRWGVSAAISILFVRAIVLQVCIFLHMQSSVFGRIASLNKPVTFLISIMCIFSSIVAVFKDIPDLEGDKVHGINSYAVRLGPRPVFWFCIYVLTAAYVITIFVGLSSKFTWTRICAVFGHCIVVSLLWHYANKVDIKDKSSITDFYMFIWKLLYTEFFLAQFIR